MRVKTKSNDLINLSKADSICLVNYNRHNNYKLIATFGDNILTLDYYDTKEDAIADLNIIESELSKEESILYL